MYSYAHRKERKGDFRRLWVIRIGAAARLHGLSYSSFVHGLKQAGIDLNRKLLADIALNEPDHFGTLVGKARESLAV